MIKVTTIGEYESLDIFKTYCKNNVDGACASNDCKLFFICDFLKKEPNDWDIKLELSKDDSNSN